VYPVSCNIFLINSEIVNSSFLAVIFSIQSINSLYLRLIQNHADNLSLNRIINEPKRGIGKTSLDKIAIIAEQNNVSMYEIIKNADVYGLNRVFLNSREFIDCIENILNLNYLHDFVLILNKKLCLLFLFFHRILILQQFYMEYLLF